MATSDLLADAVALDMNGYCGRAQLVAHSGGVCGGVSGEAAARLADMKVDMAEAAEQLLAATDWLPPISASGTRLHQHEGEGPWPVCRAL